MSEPVLRRPQRPVVPSGQPRRTRDYGGEDRAAWVRPTADPALYDWAVEVPEWDSGRHGHDGSSRVPILTELPDLLAAEPATVPHEPVSGGGGKLTRRGRAVLVVALTVAATVAGSLLFLAKATAGDLPSGASAATAAHDEVDDFDEPEEETVIVQDGDTLWGIAERVRPTEDPRRTVHEIVEVNDLDGSTLNPGQELVVPVP
ncbi:LysM peptidoglycan-binding domain-containing protein [Halostreptopolyspora alba]|uniref:LysM peptidoglycan-binding domain-containing protein n=1 Tax=Halostreptopolyspora alba TaxID=2487137 RepID=A0A3N0EHN6_9ACTN|nr:LysM peptidoglycan-binding domain-containing protein [Nocardiopsaceae bacterium YIM 96095]